MRLFFDARYIRTDFHDGISRFSAELAAATAELAGEGSDVASGVQNGDEDSPDDVHVTFLIHDDDQRRLLPDGSCTLKIHSPTSAKEPFTARILNKYRPDVVFSPMQTIGSWGRKFGLILTLHDTIYYRHRKPPKDLPALVRLGWRAYHLSYVPQRIVLNGADIVATVSETSRREFGRVRLTKRPVIVLGNAAQRLGDLVRGSGADFVGDDDVIDDTAAGGVDSDAVSGADAASRGRSARAPRNIVYMGSFMPYKNVETLVRGMAALPDHTLHLLSRISASRKRELEALVPTGASVVFHNGVSDTEYAEVLNDRAILATLSLDEGYGVPIAEALAFGVPAVVSDTEIFREVAGGGALFVAAQDADGFASAVQSLDDDALRQSIVHAGLAHAATYSWQKTARTLLIEAQQLVASRAK